MAVDRDRIGHNLEEEDVDAREEVVGEGQPMTNIDCPYTSCITVDRDAMVEGLLQI